MQTAGLYVKVAPPPLSKVSARLFMTVEISRVVRLPEQNIVHIKMSALMLYLHNYNTVEGLR